MADTWNKKEREKKKQQTKKDKAERKQERKEAPKSKDLNDMLAYVDENGNLTTTPPDLSKKKIIKTAINGMGQFLPRRSTTIHNNALAAKQLTIATGASEFRLK